MAVWTHDTPGVSCPGQHLSSPESEPVEPETTFRYRMSMLLNLVSRRFKDE